MILERLSLTNFKNIEHATLEFSSGVNCLLGNNGMGKSNLLDALYFLSFTKSFTGMTDAQLIRRGETWAMLKGEYMRRDTPEEITAALRQGARKSFRRAGKEYQRLHDHIGAFPLVMVSPADMDLAVGAPEVRRRFLDQIIAQHDPRYLAALGRYSQSLEQRNRMLRDGVTDRSLFEAVEFQMDGAARYLTDARVRAVERLREYFAPLHSGIGGDSPVGLNLESRMAQNPDTPLTAMLDARRERDAILKYTTVGPHRDDLEFTLQEMPLRRCASQGQTKTYTVALRLAQFAMLRESLEVTPLLLLDDIFDKLDASRVEAIMAMTTRSGQFGQIFITDTNRKHLDEIIRALPQDSEAHRLWTVSAGNFEQS